MAVSGLSDSISLVHGWGDNAFHLSRVFRQYYAALYRLASGDCLREWRSGDTGRAGGLVTRNASASGKLSVHSDYCSYASEHLHVDEPGIVPGCSRDIPVTTLDRAAVIAGLYLVVYATTGSGKYGLKTRCSIILWHTNNNSGASV